MTFLAPYIVRWRYGVIGAWVILFALVAPQARHVHRVVQVQGTGTASSESRRANELIDHGFSRPVGDAIAIVVRGDVPIEAPRFEQVLDSLSAAFDRHPAIQGVVRPLAVGDSTYLSADRQTTLLGATIRPPPGVLAPDLIEELRAVVTTVLRQAGVDGSFTAQITGGPALDHDTREVSVAETGSRELRALPPALLVLVLAFGALVAALVPVIVGLAAISIALGLIAIVGEWQPMSIFVINISTMVGLGVGIDYSLLVVTRFREELNRGQSQNDAAIRTIRTAGTAVVISGLTVLVGFAALLTTPLIETRSVGVGGLLVVAVAVLLSTTLLPAALAIMGRNVDRPTWLAKRLVWFHAPTGWERWARWLTHHPWHAIVVGGGLVALMTAPLSQIRIGLPASNWYPASTESSQALETLRDMGVSGAAQPIRIIVQVPPGESVVSSKHLPALRAFSDSLRSNPRVRRVRSVVDVRPGISMLAYTIVYGNLDAARVRFGPFLDSYLSVDGSMALLELEVEDTTTLTGSMDVVRETRKIAARMAPTLGGAEVYVGGFAASSVDLQDQLLQQFPRIVLIILGVTGVMLFIAFRSILVPIKAILLNTLSVAATFGLTVLVFQQGVGGALFGLDEPTGAIFVVVPVLVFAIVFGLSMDYEVFLLSRIKESFDRTGRNDYATLEGLSATASVITSAAAIMILVFGTFAFAEVMAAKFLGFTLAVAVFLDATLIRMVLVPAIMHVAGRWNWWPGVRTRANEKG